MIEDNIEVNVSNTIEVVDVFPQITEEVVDINISDNSEDVVINVTESIIEVNINKVTNVLSAVWGSITGTLSSQTDLQSALNAKQNSLSGTGFVKISGTTISYDNSNYYPYPTGLASQYVRGDGAIATLPTSTGGGSSVNYYLNGGTAASVGGYYQMSNTAVIGTGVDFSRGTDGVIAQFLTDLGNPNRLVIPAGNWNFESYFSASSIGGSPSYYLSLYKYNGTTFTLIADSSAAPKPITSGTTIDLYISSLAVPETTLLSTDRLAVRVNIIASGKTITLHTQNSHLCQVITTFSTGIGALNGLTANTQYLAIGTSGTDANISSVTDTHTFNFPSASATNRGLLLSADWTTFNNKANALSGTINTLTYWASATTIGSLALASYPSLTEISYIKGLGSAVQTQINTKIGGSGTSGYVSKFNGTGTTITNSLIYDNGTSVGIGTTAFNLAATGRTLLSLSGANSNLIELQVAGTNQAYIYNGNAGNLEIYGYQKIDFGTNGSTRLTINSSGSVGIGTTSPNVELALYQASTPRFHLQNSTSGTGSTSGFQIALSSTDAYLWNFQNGASIFATNNVERMRITSGGNVGIGTSVTNGKLTILEATTSFEVNTSSTLSSILSYDRTGGVYKQLQFRGSEFIFSPSDVEKMRLTNAGNLGIGTTSPATKLQVEDTNKVFDAYGNVNIFTTDTAATNIGGSIAFGGKNSSGGTSPYPFAKIQGIKEGSAGNYNGALLFGTTANSSAIIERMRIDSSGNVGIGTTASVRRLEVASDSSNWISGTFSGGGGTDKVVIGNLGNTATIGGHTSALTAWANLALSGSQLLFQISGTEKMRLDASGNLGIGYTAPTQKLDVNGNIKADGYISSFGNAGITQLVNFIDLDGFTHDLSFENGLLVSYSVA